MSKFDTHGGYFAPQDYMRVNEGGSHEENPNGGVQVGVDPEGNPNLLEEGEPVYKDYVYSDNIEAEEQFLVDNNLPKKYVGKLYSKIADDLFAEAEERPLDPISRNGLEVLLSRLADAQEGQKQAKEQRDLEDELANLSPEELEQLEAMLSQEQMSQEQIVPEEQMVGLTEPLPQEGIGETLVMDCGGKIAHKYPNGGLLLDPAYVTAKYNPVRVNAPRFVTGPGMFPMDLSPRAITDWNWSDDYLDPAYVFADGPQNPSVYGTAQAMPPLTLRGINGNIYGISDASENTVLPTSVVTADAPSNHRFDYRVVNTRPDGLKITPHPIVDIPSSSDDEEEKSVVESEQENGNGLLPTWPRYVGAIGSGLLGLYNAFQAPDKYTAPRYNPSLPEGRINLQNQVYNPVDQNMIANAQIAQGNATNRALRNSGLGPSYSAAILAADNNLTGNLGTGFLQTWDANNQRRSAVIAANNQAEAQRAQFDYTVDAARKDALNRAALYNGQNDLMVQRLNNEAEGAKYQAISNQISNGLQALSGIGQENFAMNQINTNPAFLGYGVGVNGGMYYNPITKRWEKAVTQEKESPVPATTTTKVSQPIGFLNPGPFARYDTNPFPGYTWNVKEGRKKKGN